MESELKLPRDEFSTALRALVGNPGAVKSTSRIDIADFYGRSETWTVDLFRVEGVETGFLQRVSAEGSLRLVLPPQVMTTLTRQHDGLTGKMRARGARQAVATRIARGDTLGNPAALAKARKKRKHKR